MRFEKHIFICTNQKENGKAFCGNEQGMQLVEKFKAILKEKGLNAKVRAQRSGCLDACKNGPALVIYPEGVFYGHVTLNDVDRIIEEHVLNNKLVDDLLLTF